jgi:hypothetical protein
MLLLYHAIDKALSKKNYVSYKGNKMTKDEALRMAIEWLDNQQLGYSGHSVRKACQEALAQPTAEQSSLVQEPVAYQPTSHWRT